MLYRIIIVYLIIVLVYFKIHGVKKNKIEKFIFSICIPIFGLIITILSEISENKKISTSKNYTNTSKNKIEKSKEFLTNIQSSVVDDLDLKDYRKTRDIILSMQTLPLKKQCEICQITIWSKNVEISHISAVSLMRIKTYFEKFFVHMETYMDLSKIENIERYINGLNNYLECKIVYGSLREEYVNKIISLLKELLEKKSNCEEKYYRMLINRCLEAKKYDETKKYAKILLDKFGANEERYKEVLKAYYEIKDENSLKDIINKLKDIPKLTKESKEIVEFWEGERM